MNKKRIKFNTNSRNFDNYKTLLFSFIDDFIILYLLKKRSNFSSNRSSVFTDNANHSFPFADDSFEVFFLLD